MLPAGRSKMIDDGIGLLLVPSRLVMFEDRVPLPCHVGRVVSQRGVTVRLRKPRQLVVILEEINDASCKRFGASVIHEVAIDAILYQVGEIANVGDHRR